MFFADLISRGGPVLYLLFLLTLIIFTVLVNKYYFVFVDKNYWYKNKLDNFYALYPPERIKLYNVEKTFLSEYLLE